MLSIITPSDTIQYNTAPIAPHLLLLLLDDDHEVVHYYYFYYYDCRCPHSFIAHPPFPQIRDLCTYLSIYLLLFYLPTFLRTSLCKAYYPTITYRWHLVPASEVLVCLFGLRPCLGH
jgi:hypothetical protein